MQTKTKTKTKTDIDKKLIKEVFGYVPVDWARYPDGRISFISLTGQKFSYTNEQFENIREAVHQERAASKKLSSKSRKKKSPPTDTLDSGIAFAQSNKKHPRPTPPPTDNSGNI